VDFIVNNGPFIKDKNNIQKILLTNLFLLIPFIIYKFYIAGINSIIIFILSIISILGTSIIFDYIKYKNININKYYKDITFSIIITIILPCNTSYIVLLLVNIIVTTLSKFYDIINIYIISSFLICLFTKFTNNNLIYNNYNIYIYSLLLFISLIVLVINRSVKFRICISYILFVIIKLLFNQSISEIDYILLFMSIYVIPEFKSTPNTAFIQIIFGITIGILTIFLNIEYIFLSIIILNVVFKYIDINYSYFLAKY